MNDSTPNIGPHAGPSEPRRRTSSYSAGEGQCVEVADLPGVVALRDSKNPHLPALRYPAACWRTFRQELTAHRP